MHAQMMPISLRGQEIILAHLSPKDITRLNNLLRRMLEETRAMRSTEMQEAARDRDQSADAH